MKKESCVELFVPGRLCLFGEHSDWAGTNRTMNSCIVPGRAIVTGIEQGIYGVAWKSELFSVRSDLPEYKNSSFSCKMDMGLLREEAKKGGFFSYVAGVASYLTEWYHVGGITLEITKMDLPMRSGLSSSAAICVMIAQAFNRLYDLHLNTLGIMNIAYWGEQRTPSRCGRLDQACAFGINAVSMTFDGNEMDVERISIKKPLYYVFADLMVQKDTIRILADLNSGYPFAKSDKEKKMHEALGEDNREITGRAICFLSEGNAEALGKLMTEAQALFDEKVAPMCPDELKSPVLHSVLNDEKIIELSYGAKGVGSQGDGTVQILATSKKTQDELVNYLENERHMTTYSLTLKPTKTIRKAVIPVAGFGTRLYPQTRGVKKEFCPVVDKDGLLKPGIMILLEELEEIEIEEIALILNKDEKEYYEKFFFEPLSDNHYNKLTEPMKQYEKKINRIASKIRFIFQEEQKGFGHAVFQAADFAAGEPVLLLLGDTIYESNSPVPCTKQVIDAYTEQGVSMIGVQSVSLESVGNYGIFSGVWEDKDEKLIKLTKIEEKPNITQAENYLGMVTRVGVTNYYAAFGTYVITTDVFERLKWAINDEKVNEKGEIELTDALAYVMEQKGMDAVVVDGRSFDLGNPVSYREAVAEYGKR